jgi:putative holliday junction resolvase
VRVLALDLGTKRIGVAVSDLTGTIATPRTVLDRTGQVAQDHRRIAALVAEEEAELVVVGLPLSMDGSVGRAAQAAIDEAAALAEVVGVPVETFDERLTSVSANRSLLEARMSREARRRLVDKVAAAVILQTWLDARSGREARS